MKGVEAQQRFNIVLTGSTGNLGCYVLDNLLKNKLVQHVHCLVRSEDAELRQRKAMASRGLHLWESERVHFHVTALEASPDLGLSGETLQTLQASATHLLHCAWPVDWNRNFSSFQPAIQGVNNILRFVQGCKLHPVLFFVSSVAAVGNWGAVPGTRQAVPEEEVEDWKVARFGYGQSKLVSERLIAQACRSGHATAAICRVGQLAGPTLHGDHGSWPVQEWLPSLLASSKHLGTLPETLGPMDDLDWVPVDSASSIIVELLLSGNPDPLQTAFYHISNPSRTPWQQLRPLVQGTLGSLRTAPLDEWVRLLQESRHDGQADLDRNPAYKLMPVFDDLADKAVHLPKARAPVLDVGLTVKVSPTLANLQPVNEAWMTQWMRQLSLQQENDRQYKQTNE